MSLCFLTKEYLSCWADVRSCEAIREAVAVSAVSFYLYRNSPEMQTPLVFNLIDRNMTNPPKEHLWPQLVWHLVYWQVSPPGGSPLPTADSEQQCVGAQSDGRIPETESGTRYFPFFNRKQLIVKKLHCLFPIFRCVTLKVEMINWQNTKRCKHGGEKEHAHKSRRCNLQVIRIRLGRHAKVKEGSWPEKDSSIGWGFVNM